MRTRWSARTTHVQVGREAQRPSPLSGTMIEDDRAGGGDGEHGTGHHALELVELRSGLAGVADGVRNGPRESRGYDDPTVTDGGDGGFDLVGGAADDRRLVVLDTLHEDRERHLQEAALLLAVIEDLYVEREQFGRLRSLSSSDAGSRLPDSAVLADDASRRPHQRPDRAANLERPSSGGASPAAFGTTPLGNQEEIGGRDLASRCEGEVARCPCWSVHALPVLVCAASRGDAAATSTSANHRFSPGLDSHRRRGDPHRQC